MERGCRLNETLLNLATWALLTMVAIIAYFLRALLADFKTLTRTVEEIQRMFLRAEGQMNSRMSLLEQGQRHQQEAHAELKAEVGFLRSHFGKAALVLLVAGQLLTGCVTYRRCAERYGSLADTVFVQVKHEVPADSAFASLPLDSLGKDTLHVRKGRAMLKLAVVQDSTAKASQPLRRLWAQAKCDSIVIHDTVPCPPVTQFNCPNPQLHLANAEEPPWWQRAWHSWQRFSGFVLLGYIGFQLLRRR